MMYHLPMHKNPSGSCTSCENKLCHCDPRIIEFVKNTQANFIDCHIAVGYRDQAEQQTALQTGKSRLPWPKSKHNFIEAGQPMSHAVDLFRLGDDDKAHFEAHYYEQIWLFYSQNKGAFQGTTLKILWGGTWITFKDLDHFELTHI